MDKLALGQSAVIVPSPPPPNVCTKLSERIGSAGEEMEKNPAALDTVETQRVKIMKLRVWIGSKLNLKGKYQRRGNNRCTAPRSGSCFSQARLL